jgi:CheY-like chemotaxis protein
MARILVADDDLEQVLLRKDLLEAGGYEVDVALCTNTTAQMVERGGADLVIMDLRFANALGEPDSRQGLALIRRIRELGCQAPVIVLSGWPEDLYGQPEEHLVSKVIVKPVPVHVLLSAVAELTGLRGQAPPPRSTQ